MNRKTILASLAFVLAAMVSPAWAGAGAPGHRHEDFSAGEPGNPARPSRVVQIMMRDDEGAMHFTPNHVEIRKGEQIKFVIRNNGALEHEFVLATEAQNLKHAKLMEKYPDMEHDDPNAIRIDPNKTGEILWRFTKAGTFEFDCLIPGHREAGMTGTVVVN